MESARFGRALKLGHLAPEQAIQTDIQYVQTAHLIVLPLNTERF